MDEMKKYIIEFSEDPHTIRLMKIKNGDKFPMTEFKAVKPYTEPDTSEVYQRGYDDAKHECQDCQKIMMDAEQERVDKAYQQGVNDAENRRATCEFCEYTGKDVVDEPCSTCCCGYLNRFRPKRLVPKADSRIRKKIEGIMESFDCTISDFEKAIEEIKNEAD